tara:strand:- start:1685 stop:3034 length:1350 start_codon:yes stop_codon:yes gene_type:complete
MPNAPAQAANFKKLSISSNSGGGSVDMSSVTPEFRYYESILSNVTTAALVVSETGYQMDGNSDVATRGILDGLPIRGGERVDISIEDNYGNILDLSRTGMYVNRVKNATPGTQSDMFMLDLCSKEYFANEQTRVVKRYEGKISDNVINILTQVLKADAAVLDVDSTAIEYNFIGNDRKPLYVCTWLAAKSVPLGTSNGQGNSVGGAAGYLFFQTRDGFHFRSIDTLFEGSHTKKFLYSNTADDPGGSYDAKIVSYDIERDVDLKESMTLGAHNNRSLFFDFYSMNYKVVKFDIGQQKPKLSTSGRDFAPDMIARDFTQSPTRLFNHILDVGTQPKGMTSDAQLKNWKDNPEASNYDAERSMVQSVMRYNQMFAIQTNITIPLDVSIKAGDLIYCDFPELKGSSGKETNDQSGGIYMVAHICHRVNPTESFSSLSLVRDSFGKNTGFSSK